VTTAQEPIAEARPGDNDDFYMDLGGDDNLTDSKGERHQPPTHASAASKTASAKRQRNDGDGSPSAPQAKKSANETDFMGKTIFKGSPKVVLKPQEGWLHSGGVFRPPPAHKPKPDDTSFEHEDQNIAIVLILQAHYTWRNVNVEIPPNIFKSHQNRERHLNSAEPRYKILNREQLSQIDNSYSTHDNMYISEEVAVHLRFYKKCEPQPKGKGKGKGRGGGKSGNRLRIYDEPAKFEYFPNEQMSHAEVCQDIQMGPCGKKPEVKRSHMTWPREGKQPTPRQIDMLYRYWDYLPKTLKTFTPPEHMDHAFKVLGRGHDIGYSLAILGLDSLDTESEKKYLWLPWRGTVCTVP
jgi:hypothetical protein